MLNKLYASAQILSTFTLGCNVKTSTRGKKLKTFNFRAKMN